jgi:phage tail sheath protein FI
MAIYEAPGVYVEEVSGGTRPIEAVGTSTAAFLGLAPDPGAHMHEAVSITNWSQFAREYASNPGAVNTPLSHAVYGFFRNGGGICYVVNVGPDNQIGGGGSNERRGVDILETLDRVAIVAAPGFSDASSHDALLTHCEKMRDRVAVLDAPLNVPNLDVLTRAATLTGAGAAPRARRREAGGEAGTPPPDTPPPTGLHPRPSDNGFGAFYFPWIKVLDPSTREVVDVPPSGHIAGIYARTDATRGVHKAPANETIRGALGVTYAVTQEEQAQLNPAGVNVIRAFDREGIRVWGARTVAPPGNEWRYLNVRRLFSMIEKSIERSTRWCVFEPNDQPLWKSIRRDVSAFLMLLWRQGALMGATPDEAFFVQCDRETNPPEVVDAGQVVTVIGAAPVKPAEFVIFRISQSAAGAEIER